MFIIQAILAATTAVLGTIHDTRQEIARVLGECIDKRLSDHLGLPSRLAIDDPRTDFPIIPSRRAKEPVLTEDIGHDSKFHIDTTDGVPHWTATSGEYGATWERRFAGTAVITLPDLTQHWATLWTSVDEAGREANRLVAISYDGTIYVCHKEGEWRGLIRGQDDTVYHASLQPQWADFAPLLEPRGTMASSINYLTSYDTSCGAIV